MLSLSTVDWSPFITYIDTTYPGAIPYLHALMLIIPFIGWLCWLLMKVLPPPGSTISTISDDELKQKIPQNWYNRIDKPVQWINQLIVVINWILRQSLYRGLFHIIVSCAADFGKKKSKEEIDDIRKDITIPAPYKSDLQKTETTKDKP